MVQAIYWSLFCSDPKCFLSASKIRTDATCEEDDEFEDEVDAAIVRRRVLVRRTRLRGFAEEVVPTMPGDVFRSHFRIPADIANVLENKISPQIVRQGVDGRNTVPPRKQLLSVLWILATPDSFRSVAEKFGFNKSTLHDCFKRVIFALNSMARSEICWPTQNEKIAISAKFRQMSGFPDVVGAIDGCHIEIDAPSEHASSYRTGKKKYAIQLQAVCTTDLIFTDCFAGYPGSVHDSRVLRNSPLHRDANHLFDDGTYLLGDKAYYPVKLWCIPPYKDNGHLTESQQKFNKAHSKARQVIERAFALLKGRFRRLKHLVMYRTDLIPFFIMAACVLHNICLKGVEDEDIGQYVAEGAPVENLELVAHQEHPLNENDDGEALRKRDEIKNML